MNTTSQTSSCKDPLVSAEFNSYDTTPDGTLYSNELGENKLECFIDRYISTDDKDVRSEFRDHLADGLWLNFRKIIKQKRETNPYDPEITERLKYITENEFSDDSLRINTTTNLDHTATHSISEYSNSTFTLDKSIDSILGKGGFSLRHPLSDHLWMRSYGEIVGNHYEQKQEENLSGKTDQYRYSYNSLKGSLWAKLLDDQDFFTLQAYGEGTNHFSPPPDSLLQSRNANIRGALQDLTLLDNPLLLSASASLYQDIYSAPRPETHFFQKQTENLSAQATATYRIQNLGIVSEYNQSQYAGTSSFSIDNSTSQSASLLLQYTLDKDFIRGGLGFGNWSGESLALGESNKTTFRGGQYFLTINSLYRLTNDLRLTGGGTLNIKESQGTFEGYYPSWNLYINSIYEKRPFNISLSLNYSGHDIDLNEKQNKQALNGSLDFTYRINDRLKIKVIPSFSVSDVKGYRNNQNLYAGIHTNISWHTPIENLWTWGYAGSNFYSYKDFNNNEFSGTAFWTGLGASYEF